MTEDVIRENEKAVTGVRGECQERLEIKKGGEKEASRRRGRCKGHCQMLQTGECPLDLVTWRPLGIPDRVG